ncbi:hypothetical protein BD779DRAFT_1472398 [Infundibulicybe gibba]|nr:hypothetical protein BD779DRAFT_1472398 [Infundibulicybe gibba]
MQHAATLRLAKLNVIFLSLSNSGPTAPAAAARNPRLPDLASRHPYNVTPYVATLLLQPRQTPSTQYSSEVMGLPAWNLAEEDGFGPSLLPPPRKCWSRWDYIYVYSIRVPN